MPLPGVKITVGDGALGRTVATDDGVAGLVLTGVAATSLALNTAARIYSLPDAVALGIVAATNPHAHREISEFYDKAGNGAELWIMLVAQATTHAAVFVATTGPMHVLLAAAGGRITIAATSMGRIGGYTPTMTGIVDFDLPAVATLAQTLANVFAAAFAPVRIILDGTYLIDPLTGVVSLKGNYDRVGTFVGCNATGRRAASMGAFIGTLAAIPVHQDVGRTKSGPFSPNGALTSGKALSAYSDAQLASLFDAGIMVLRSFLGLQGAFVASGITMALDTSDYTSLANCRVIDKAIRLTYQTYVLQINDTIAVTDAGEMLPTQVSYLEDVITNALTQRMVAEGNCSAVAVYIDPKQLILKTSKLGIVLKVRPLGYLKDIEIALGFTL